MAGRYAHAKQFNRHRGRLQLRRTRLGRLIRDIGRNITGHAELETAFAGPLSNQIRSSQCGWKLYSFHVPEVDASAEAMIRPARVLAPRSPSSPTKPELPADGPCCMPRRCPAIPPTGTRSPPPWKPPSVSRASSAAMSTRDIAATKRRTRTASSSPDRSAAHRCYQTRNQAPLRHRRRDRSHETDDHLGRCHLKGRHGDAANAILTVAGLQFPPRPRLVQADPALNPWERSTTIPNANRR
jgi:transposase, IS5 family